MAEPCKLVLFNFFCNCFLQSNLFSYSYISNSFFSWYSRGSRYLPQTQIQKLQSFLTFTCNRIHMIKISWIITLCRWIKSLKLKAQCNMPEDVNLSTTAVILVTYIPHMKLVRIYYSEITNKMRPYIRIYYSNVSYCSTCFERHISHHQELKNFICSLWFYISLWLPAAIQLWQRPATTDLCETKGCKYSFWASDDERCVARNMLSNKKLWNNKF